MNSLCSWGLFILHSAYNMASVVFLGLHQKHLLCRLYSFSSEMEMSGDGAPLVSTCKKLAGLLLMGCCLKINFPLHPSLIHKAHLQADVSLPYSVCRECCIHFGVHPCLPYIHTIPRTSLGSHLLGSTSLLLINWPAALLERKTSCPRAATWLGSTVNLSVSSGL